jgi:hypothetical protein
MRPDVARWLLLALMCLGFMGPAFSSFGDEFLNEPIAVSTSLRDPKTVGLATTDGSSALALAASQMQVGDFRILETNGFGGELLEVPGGHTILEWGSQAYWNPMSRSLHFQGAGHYDEGKYIIYHEDSNTWELRMINSRAGEIELGHAYGHNALNPANGDFYFRGYLSKTIYKYLSESNSWYRYTDVATGDGVQVASAIEYFPEMGGLVFVDSYIGVWVFDEGDASWTQYADGALSGGTNRRLDMNGSYNQFAVYHPTQKIVLFGGGNGSENIWKMNAEGFIQQVSNSPLNIGSQGLNLILPNTRNGTFNVFADTGNVYEYSVQSDRWQVVGRHAVQDYTRHWKAGGYIPEYNVAMFITYNFESSKVLLYKF